MCSVLWLTGILVPSPDISLPQASEAECFINKKIDFSVYSPVTPAFVLEILTLFITRKHLQFVVVKFVSQRFGSCLRADVPDFIRQKPWFPKKPNMFTFTSLRPMQTFPKSGKQSLMWVFIEDMIHQTLLSIMWTGKMSSINWRKRNSKCNLLVFHSPAEDIQKEAILGVFRSRDFNSQMCFRK